MSKDIDTSAAEKDINLEKVADLEAQLAKYKEADDARLAAEEEAKKNVLRNP